MALGSVIKLKIMISKESGNVKIYSEKLVITQLIRFLLTLLLLLLLFITCHCIEHRSQIGNKDRY